MLIALLLMACGNDMGFVQVPGCVEEESSVAANEETFLGFTPEEAANEMPLSNTVGLEWEDGTIDCLHYSLQLDPDSGRDVDSTYAELDSEGSVATIYIECTDFVAIDGTLSMSTPDGEINEEIAIKMVYQMDGNSGDFDGNFINSKRVASFWIQKSYFSKDRPKSVQNR